MPSTGRVKDERLCWDELIQPEKDLTKKYSTAEQISQTLGLSRRATQDALARLRKEDKIRYVFSKGAYYYEKKEPVS